VQLLKNIVPEPLLPDIGGSSPLCTHVEPITGKEPELQKPVSSNCRLTPQALGQISHADSLAESAFDREANSPELWRLK
jgi:hypothetical protein